MLRTELIHSCSSGLIADAASRSLGCGFRARIVAAANCEGCDPGAFAAGLVRHFSDGASADDWCELDRAMTGEDMPLLMGFRFIVDRMLVAEGETRCRGAISAMQSVAA